MQIKATQKSQQEIVSQAEVTNTTYKNIKKRKDTTTRKQSREFLEQGCGDVCT